MGYCAVYVANADSQDMSVLRLDAADGTLTEIETVTVGGTVMPMALSPDRRRLYAAVRSAPYRALSFSIDPASGRLTALGEAPLAESMAAIDVDRSGRWLFAASYGGHLISVNAVDEQGIVGAIRQVIPTGRHAHAIHADAANRFVLATSLGGDELSSWRFDAGTGRLSANAPASIATAAGAGPRHFVWDAAQRHLYLLCELDASVSVYDYDAARGSLTERQRTTALPLGFSGKPWAADLHLSPDGRHLYASERTSSTLAVFEVDAQDGGLRTQAHVATESTPRGFAIDPTGRWLIAAGQGSDAVAVHAVDRSDGSLTLAHRYGVGRNPNWIETIELI